MIAPSVLHDEVPALLLTGLMEFKLDDAEATDERVLGEVEPAKDEDSTAEDKSLAVIVNVKNVVTATVADATWEVQLLHVGAAGAYVDTYVVELTVVVLYSVTILLFAAAAEAALMLEYIVVLVIQALQMAHACCMVQQT